MPDTRFFPAPKPKTLKDITEISGATLDASVDVNAAFDDLASLSMASPTDISFFDNVKYKQELSVTKAGAIFIDPDLTDLLPEGAIGLFSKNPYKSYALTAQAFYPTLSGDSQISEHATVAKSAQIASGVTISAGAHIGENVEIGESTQIGHNAVILDGVKIGAHCRIGSNTTLSHTLIGNHVSLYPGVRVGQDGFGFAIDPAGHVKVPQLGRVIIEDHVEIGANTTIDRGAGPDTVIGQGTWIDNLVQIGHNTKIGKGCVIVSQVGISGSTTLEDYVVLAGQVGVAGHLTIGMGARIAAQSGIMRDIPPGEEHMGSPSMPIKQYMRQVAALKRLIKRPK